MKAEDKFLHVSGCVNLACEICEKAGDFVPESVPARSELRELLDFWDAHQWIPAAHRPEKDGERIWMWDGCGAGDKGYYDSASDHFYDCNGYKYFASHWMPLPKGPQ